MAWIDCSWICINPLLKKLYNPFWNKCVYIFIMPLGGADKPFNRLLLWNLFSFYCWWRQQYEHKYECSRPLIKTQMKSSRFYLVLNCVCVYSSRYTKAHKQWKKEQKKREYLNHSASELRDCVWQGTNYPVNYSKEVGETAIQPKKIIDYGLFSWADKGRIVVSVIAISIRITIVSFISAWNLLAVNGEWRIYTSHWTGGNRFLSRGFELRHTINIWVYVSEQSK